MKAHSPDEIMAEVHAAKDKLSHEAGYDVARLIAASRARHPAPAALGAKTRSKSKKTSVRRRSPKAALA
jgi:hypothetical protein